MITLLLIFLACGDDTSKETTTTTDNTATEQVETLSLIHISEPTRQP